MPENAQASYATDGTDFRRALGHHYTIALKRFVKYLAIFGPTFVLVLMSGIRYLLPLAIVGAIGLFGTVIYFCSSVNWIWKCSRVFRNYSLEFRSPVEKVDMAGHTKLILRLGKKGADGSPTMRAINLSSNGWPVGVVDGVWFAGDDAFGGAALVPGTGELLFMQPKEWTLTAEQRKNAGMQRAKNARQAGIKRRVPIR